MQLETFDIVTPNTQPPAQDGWIRYWHGYHQMRKVKSDEKRELDRQEDVEAEGSGALTERDVEIQVFCNALRCIDSSHVTMFELGAGRGDWCLAMAGIIDHRLIPLPARSYRCLALEGEPSHFSWTSEHFVRQAINGIAVHGAAARQDGVCRFRALKAPDESYGQGVDHDKGNIVVPCYSIDMLMERYGFEHLNLIHMDVQGEEYETLLGAEKALALPRARRGRDGGDRVRPRPFPQGRHPAGPQNRLRPRKAGQ